MTSGVMCGEVIDLDFAKLTEKGCIGINNACKERKLNILDITYSADIEFLCISHTTLNKTI